MSQEGCIFAEWNAISIESGDCSKDLRDQGSVTCLVQARRASGFASAAAMRARGLQPRQAPTCSCEDLAHAPALPAREHPLGRPKRLAIHCQREGRCQVEVPGLGGWAIQEHAEEVPPLRRGEVGADRPARRSGHRQRRLRAAAAGGWSPKVTTVLKTEFLAWHGKIPGKHESKRGYVFRRGLKEPAG